MNLKIKRTLKLLESAFYDIIDISVIGKGKLIFSIEDKYLTGRISEKKVYININDFEKKISIKEFSDSKTILSIVKSIRREGLSLVNSNPFIDNPFKIGIFYENLNLFNEKNNFKCIAKIIKKEDEHIYSYSRNINFKKKYSIYEETILIEYLGVKIIFPISYISNKTKEVDEIIIEDITTGNEDISKRYKFKKKILKWLKRYQSEYPNKGKVN